MKSILNRIIEGGYREKIELPIDSVTGSLLIYNLLEKEGAAMIARFGSVELDTVLRYLTIKREKKWGISLLHEILGNRIPFKGWDKGITEPIRVNAGFFSNSIPNIEKFCELMLSCMSNVDILGSWVKGENLVLKYLPDATLVPLRSLEPYYNNPPWSRILEGKKVLVIHPYSETIQIQYQRYNLLFADKSVLPYFELKTLKAVQSIADEKVPFKDWFDALDYMKEQIMKEDFDIALIGCGAYGFPLASFVKDLGKKSVHIGGATQILFGIKGQRWDNHPVISTFYNEYWTRPGENDIPAGADKVEGGCYW